MGAGTHPRRSICAARLPGAADRAASVGPLAATGDLLCGGVRSAFAARNLQEMGYTNVYSLIGGFGGWKNAGLPFKVPTVLSAEQGIRYSRHTILDDIGEEGQIKLLDSKVLLIGAGGLGSPAAIYLAAAGVGQLGIIDFDDVDVSNLQRQVLHGNSDVGRPKSNRPATVSPKSILMSR